ncbi:regucalcin-like isoform X2 [Prorops nasuta]|uniref:regucalcin-like isoform X2 n=1 Tax=Prorops nasuta TaxID=863751 RepID=UPI0034CEFCA3
MFKFYIIISSIGLTNCYMIQKITEPLLLGEGPHWDASQQVLYFVDITNSTIHKYNPRTDKHDYTVIAGGPVTFIIPITGTSNEFLVSTGLDIRHIIWNGETSSAPTYSSILYSALQISDGSRFNDAKVDRHGSLWAGTMGPEEIPNVITKRSGKLYKISQNTGIITELKDILISNGLAWTINGSVMYYTDTGNNTIDSFDFNETAEISISNRKEILNYTKEGIKGQTDGFTIDTRGHLWLACYGGYQVIEVDPQTRKVLTSIRIHAPQVTSVTWGGANLDELYVTTARKSLTVEESKNFPDSGATFKITGLNARGYPAENYIMYKN